MYSSPLKHRLPLAVSALLIAALLVIAGLPVATASTQPHDAITLTLMHNNDGESQLIDAGSGLEDFGGIARFATVVQTVRAEIADDPDHVDLLVTSGDNFLAGPEWAASMNRPAGEPIYDAVALDHIGYDAMALGNHDFDFGPDILARFIGDFEVSQPPFLSSNLDFSGEPALQALVEMGRIAASVVIEKGGEQFGIVGAVTPNLPFISSPGDVVVDPDVVGAIQAEVDALIADGVNKIIVISHLQAVEEDLAIIPMLQGVDIVVAGGGDNVLANEDDLLVPGDVIEGPYPIIVQDGDGHDVPVVTTAGEYKYVGRLDVIFDDAGNVVSIGDASGPIRVAGGENPDAVAPDPVLQEMVADPVQAYLDDLASNIIAFSEVALDGRRNSVRGKETNEGNLLADAMLWTAERLYDDFGAAAPDVAMTNGGGIRNGTLIPAGDFSELETFGIAPFPNFISVVPDVSPEDFLALLENAVSRIDRESGLPAGDGTGRFAQVSGFRFSYRQTAAPGSRIDDVILDDGTVMVQNGQVAAGARPLNIVTVDFLAQGGDEWDTGFQDREFVNIGRSYQQALADYIQAPMAEGGLEGLISAAQYPEGGEGRILQLRPTVERSRRYNVAADTFIHGSRPALNFGSAATMWVGFDNMMRPVMKADIPLCADVYTCIPNDATVQQAYLYVYVVDGRGYPDWVNSVIDVSAHAVLTAWGEDTATWTTPWATAGGDFGPALDMLRIGGGRIGTWWRFDVTGAVGDIVAGELENHGFALSSDYDVALNKGISPEGLAAVRYGLATGEYWDAGKVGYLRVMYRTY